MYFGELLGTYILRPEPQWQTTKPANRCRGFLARFGQPVLCSVRSALQRFHTSSETIGSTLVQTHSSLGLNSALTPRGERTKFVRCWPLAVGSWSSRPTVVTDQRLPARVRYPWSLRSLATVRLRRCSRNSSYISLRIGASVGSRTTF